MSKKNLQEVITAVPTIFEDKPIIRGYWLAMDLDLGMLAIRESVQTMLEGFPWLEQDDIQAHLLFATR